jgi:hypothetical protein
MVTSCLFVDNDPEVGEIRVDEDDEVEFFDGQRWRRHADLPPDDPYTLFRNDDDPPEVTKDVTPES